MEINKIIKEKRKKLKLTMRQVADAVGVSEGTISRWESGDISNMRRDKIDLLAKTLEIPPNELIYIDKMHFEYLPREFEEAIITCPTCGYEYTHYIRTIGVDFGNEKSSGFAIEFQCEDNHTFYLIIETYKGYSYAIVTTEHNDIDILQRIRLENGFVSLDELWDNKNLAECSATSIEYVEMETFNKVFCKLNSEGQDKAIEYMKDLLLSDKYKKK